VLPPIPRPFSQYHQSPKRTPAPSHRSATRIILPPCALTSVHPHARPAIQPCQSAGRCCCPLWAWICSTRSERLGVLRTLRPVLFGDLFKFGDSRFESFDPFSSDLVTAVAAFRAGEIPPQRVAGRVGPVADHEGARAATPETGGTWDCCRKTRASATGWARRAVLSWRCLFVAAAGH
jgi:hypothetical protein